MFTFSLSRLLCQVVLNQEFNKMSLTNVATIMAPNLFLQPKSRKHLRVKENEVNMAKGRPANLAIMEKICLNKSAFNFKERYFDRIPS